MLYGRHERGQKRKKDKCIMVTRLGGVGSSGMDDKSKNSPPIGRGKGVQEHNRAGFACPVRLSPSHRFTQFTNSRLSTYYYRVYVPAVSSSLSFVVPPLRSLVGTICKGPGSGIVLVFDVRHTYVEAWSRRCVHVRPCIWLGSGRRCGGGWYPSSSLTHAATHYDLWLRSYSAPGS